MRILLVGDEQKSRRLLALGLGEAEQVTFTVVSSVAEFAQHALDRDFHLALLDWEMRSASAVEAIGLLRRRAPALPILVTVANEEAGAAARARGATECIVKPVDVDALRASLGVHSVAPAIPSAEEVPSPVARKAALPKVETETESADFNTRSPVMQRMLDMAWRVAPTPATVLILGENGTGKSVLAGAIHRRSQRKSHPFVTVHCPCLQEQLLESELFGHVKGAFTGATNDAMGKVAAADGGTLFLDEIGDLPLSIQPKLLRLLQERKYERVGDSSQRSADIRVLAATNRDLQAEVKAGRFREDLFYRLNVVSIEVLPMRERVEDIVPAAERFLLNMGRTLQREFRGLSQLACETLRNYRWPGNVRELRNAVERAAILTDREVLDVADFAQLVASAQSPGPRVGEFVSVDSLIEEHIRLVVSRAASLEHAARILHIDRSTLYRKRKRWQTTATPFAEFTAASPAQSQVG